MPRAWGSLSHAAMMNRIIPTFLIGTTMFAAVNLLKPLTIGVGGIASILAWSVLSAYLRGKVAVAAALGAWTGVVAVATSLAAGVEPFKFDASSTDLVGPWSLVTWPAVGAMVCASISLTVNRLSDAVAKIVILMVVALAGCVVAFGASWVAAAWN